ncbi:glutathione peroxidase, partial [Volvox carteri f. nagariensis]
IDGKVRPLSEFAGKVTLVVNVASACGYTDENYKGLMKVYEKYHPHGLEILGFPCNQVGRGRRKSGTEADIKNFCSSRYHVNFPMFSKVDVNGPNTHPVYQFLKRELPEWEGGGGSKGPGADLVWNFQKIFVDHEGRPVKRLYQAWDQNAVESEVYRLLREARQAGAATAQPTS